jgi:hypothetical protein
MRVYGLVGPSGSGKSHHAPAIARRLGVHNIIDDGVLIRDGRLVAGHSAKFERNRIAAIRRALLYAPDHAAEVRHALEGQSGVLILGTSRRMVETVARNLGLPGPHQWIDITAWVPAEQVRLAQSLRRYGMHAIPAVSSPSGISRFERWLRRLRYHLPGHSSLAPDAPQLTVVTAAFADGAIHVHPRAIEQALRIFAARHAYPLRVTRLEVRRDAVPTVAVSLHAEYVPHLRQHAERFQREAAALLRHTLAMPVVAMEVRIESIAVPRTK